MLVIDSKGYLQRLRHLKYINLIRIMSNSNSYPIINSVRLIKDGLSLKSKHLHIHLYVIATQYL